VFVSVDKVNASVGERVSVSCNISGHPQPELHWLNKQNWQELVRIFQEKNTNFTVSIQLRVI